MNLKILMKPINPQSLSNFLCERIESLKKSKTKLLQKQPRKCMGYIVSGKAVTESNIEKQIHEHQKTSGKNHKLLRENQVNPNQNQMLKNRRYVKLTRQDHHTCMCQTQNLVIVKENLKSMKVTNVVFVNYFTQSRSKKVFHY